MIDSNFSFYIKQGTYTKAYLNCIKAIYDINFCNELTSKLTVDSSNKNLDVPIDGAEQQF